MTDNIDTVLFWESQGDNRPNKCRIRIYWVTWEKAIVIATDITDRPGKKIANVTQEIINFVSNLYDLFPNKMMLVEHYSPGILLDKDTYLQVFVINNEAMRYQIDKSKLTQLLGTAI